MSTSSTTTDRSGQDEERFPVLRAGEIAVEAQPRRWLIEELWGASAAGVLGGHAKACKSWLGLEMAVSVATATPCLGRYSVHEAGATLIYLAEDTLPSIRERLASLARVHGRDLDDLDVHVITTPKMRLDLEGDRHRLLETARCLRPRLLLLDPLVRLHRLEENSSAEISELLSYLREVQRELDLALVLVHHTRKNAPSRGQAGLGLRGSSDLWAFGDSNLYLRRVGDRLELSVEHRFAPASGPIALRLEDHDPEAVHLKIDSSTATTGSSKDRVEQLSDAVLHRLMRSGPMTRAQLRQELRVKNQTLGHTLMCLEGAQRIERTPDGWNVVNPREDDRSRSHSLSEHGERNGDDIPF